MVQTLQRRKSLELVIQEGKKKKKQYYVKKTVNTLAYAHQTKSVVLRAKFSGRRGRALGLLVWTQTFELGKLGN